MRTIAFRERRRDINQWYRNLLADVPGITFQSEPGADFYSNFWLTAVTIDPSRTGVDREAVRLRLLEENIESRPLWKPMHMQPVFDPQITQIDADIEAERSKLKAERGEEENTQRAKVKARRG